MHDSIRLQFALTPGQKIMVRETFALLAPAADEVAAQFYARLFEVAPHLQGLFSSDMRDQRRKLMHVLGVAIQALDDLESIVPTVQALGRRHAGYGVSSPDFAPVGQALLWILEQRLGDAFRPEVRQAWVMLYEVLVGIMDAALAEATAAHEGI